MHSVRGDLTGDVNFFMIPLVNEQSQIVNKNKKKTNIIRNHKLIR
jgi:hypothetical protein